MPYSMGSNPILPAAPGANVLKTSIFLGFEIGTPRLIPF